MVAAAGLLGLDHVICHMFVFVFVFTCIFVFLFASHCIGLYAGVVAAAGLFDLD